MLQPLARIVELPAGQGAPMKISPVGRNFGIDLVMRPTDHVGRAAAQPFDPTLAGRDVAHLAIEHRHRDWRLVDEGAQYFCTGVRQWFYSIRHADYPALA